MGYLNVPANGWPQLKDLEKLDKIAQQMENMPTFTSDDRIFLEALPAMPTEEGKRVLTAVTDDQGETDLTYETPDVEGADIAPTFSESVTYPAGTLVYYDGILYKFTEDHAAGAWDPLEVTTSSITAELDELKNTITNISRNTVTNVYGTFTIIRYGQTVSVTGLLRDIPTSAWTILLEGIPRPLNTLMFVNQNGAGLSDVSITISNSGALHFYGRNTESTCNLSVEYTTID